MTNTVTTLDKKMHVILCTEDLLTLIEEYMGYDFKEAVVQVMNEQEDMHLDDEECIKELNDECGELSKHHRKVMQDIDDIKAQLVDLISAKELDRRAISNLCGDLGMIVSRELSKRG